MSPRNEDFPTYKGISVQHSGDWNALDYHHPDKSHSDSLRKASEVRALKPVNRKRSKLDAPKPATRIVDLATNKKVEVNPALDKENQKDLSRRGLKKNEHTNQEQC